MSRSLLILLLLATLHGKTQVQLADSIIQKSALQQTVSFLSQDSLSGRLTGSPGADIAASFIAASFDSIGLKPFAGNDGYMDHYIAAFEGKKTPSKNVVAVLPGKVSNDTMVIFSAHYDHIGRRDDMPYNKDYDNKDDIFNGANDNATGVAALLELARYYSAENNNRYRLVFIAFSGEEMSMLGSSHFITRIKPKAVKAVINLEMLGRPVNENCFIVSLYNSSIRNNLNRYLKKYQPEVATNFFITDPYPDEELSRRSDHYPFALKIKNAFTIMGSSPQDTYYHSVDDEYGTIDFDFLQRVTKNIALACSQFTK